MKKVKFAVILSFVLALSMIFAAAVPSFAAKAVDVKVDIAGADGKVFVRLTAPEGSDISTLSAAIKYDGEKLVYSTVSYLSHDSILTSTKEGENEVAANIVLADSLTDKSKIFTYIFDVAEGAEGEIAFSFENVKATDSKNNPVAINLVGNKEIALTQLEPLTPDETQNFNPTTEPSSAPETEPSTEPTTAPDKDADNTDIPNTSRKIAAVSAVGVAAAAAIAGAAVYTVRRKKK